MRALWSDTKQEPDFVKAKREAMTAIYFPVTDPLFDVRRRVSETKAEGLASGVYMAANWPEFNGLPGVDQAELMHSLVAQVEQDNVPVKVQFDIEHKDAVQIRGCLSRWRALRPKQDTSWTMEGHQGGWMLPEFVKAIIDLKIRLVPQCYEQDMSRLWDTLEMARDLTKRGFPDSLISPFHDAAKLPAWWTGYAFSQQRLP